MTDRELMQMAMETLCQARDAIAGWGSYASPYFQAKHNLDGDIDDCEAVIEAIRARLTQPEQQYLCTAAMFDDAFLVKSGLDPNTKLYTAPPPRVWVGLTDEERRGLREWQKILEELGPVWAPMMLYLYLAIETKLKEKNHVGV